MTQKPQVVIVDRADQPYIDNPREEEDLLGESCEVHYRRVKALSEVTSQNALIGCEVLLAWHGVALEPAALRCFKQCKLVVRPAAGYDDIDLKVLRECGIALCTTPSYGTEEVADHAMALILGESRSIWAVEAAARQGQWDWRFAPSNRRLRGRTLGIIGLGRIGMAVAMRAKPFGLRICFYDPHQPSGIEKALGVERAVDVETLVAQSDILTLHADLNDQSQHLIGSKQFAAAKPGLVLVNTARGALVDTSALLIALERGQVSAACLDVIEGEPEPTTALHQHPRVHLSMHSAFYSPESLAERRRLAAGVIRRYLETRAIEHRIV